MANLSYLSLVLAVFAVLFQWALKDLFFVTLGIFRIVRPIEDFPYQCRRLEHKQLEACGDLWLDEEYRVLYATCSGEAARDAWDPSLGKLNYTGRRPQGSQIMALYIDETRKHGLFKLHPIQPTNYGSEPGDGKLDLAGFDVEVLDYGSTRRFWLINQRPPYDISGKLLRPEKYGSNTTIDVYEYRKGDRKMSFVAKGWSPTLHSATRIAFTGANNFVITNQRSGKTGLRKRLDPLLGGGTLVNHDDWSDRYRVTPRNLHMPTAVVRGNDDRIYVPSATERKIRVFELMEHGLFEQAHVIDMGTAVAGLTVDSAGTLWAVARTKYDPTGRSSANSVFRIERFDEPYTRFKTYKVLEDKDSKYLKGASVVRYDARTKRLFFGGSYMPFISVCDQK